MSENNNQLNDIPQETCKCRNNIIRVLRRAALITFVSIFGFFIAFSTYIFTNQRRMIYCPRSYDIQYLAKLPKTIVKIPYATIDGKQLSFYIPPAAAPDKPPASLWVLFGGNAMVALDWLDVIEKLPESNRGFLLIDYPGYGSCEGKPTRKSIQRGSEVAFVALAEYLKVDKKVFENNCNILAFSIGNGPALEFAVNHPIKRIILAAPFTSLRDMAGRSVSCGFLFKYLLLDCYDNSARLKELSVREKPPIVDIFHGDADDIIPMEMGKKLADSYPTMAKFHQIKGSDHNWLLEITTKQLKDIIMNENKVQ